MLLKLIHVTVTPRSFEEPDPSYEADFLVDTGATDSRAPARELHRIARLLRLGANTISRWEAARNVQAASLDILLRIIRDLPGSVDYLRKHVA